MNALYVLAVRMTKTVRRRVGAMGPLSFGPGWYVYTGSARRNIRHRLERHFRPAKPLRWHVDYLTTATGVRVVSATVIRDSKLTECTLNRLMGSLAGVRTVAPGFGASDCRNGCESHLWFSPRPVSARRIARALQRTAAVLVAGALLAAGCRTAPPIAPTATVRICAVGDIMLARGVARRSRAADDPAYPFRRIADTIRGHDIAFGNLECALSNRGTRQWKGFTFRADTGRANTLSEAGFDVVAVANNHAWDFGGEAFSDTVAALNRAGIRPIGEAAGDERSRLLVTTSHGVRIGWTAYCDPRVDSYFSRTFTGKVGIALLDRETFVDDVRRAASGVDVLVVSLHWGAQYKSEVAESRRKLARAAIDAGAGIILGHHPHVLQGMEVRNGRPIIYSLGNFVFDQKPEIRNETVILEFEVDRYGVTSARIRPVGIVRSQPRLATGEQATAILNRMRDMTAALGATLTIDSGNFSGPVARLSLP